MAALHEPVDSTQPLLNERTGNGSDTVAAIGVDHQPTGVPRSRWPLVGVFALIAAALAVIVISTVLREEPTIDGPQITGPDELLVGDTGRWTHENRDGLTYEWTLPSGEQSRDVTVEWTPTGTEPFFIRLTASDRSTTTNSEMVVTVRNP